MTFQTLLGGWCVIVGLVLSALSTVLDVSMEVVLTVELSSTLRTTPRTVGVNRGLVSDKVLLVGEPLLAHVT